MESKWPSWRQRTLKVGETAKLNVWASNSSQARLNHKDNFLWRNPSGTNFKTITAWVHIFYWGTMNKTKHFVCWPQGSLSKTNPCQIKQQQIKTTKSNVSYHPAPLEIAKSEQEWRPALKVQCSKAKNSLRTNPLKNLPALVCRRFGSLQWSPVQLAAAAPGCKLLISSAFFCSRVLLFKLKVASGCPHAAPQWALRKHFFLFKLKKIIKRKEKSSTSRAQLKATVVKCRHQLVQILKHANKLPG